MPAPYGSTGLSPETSGLAAGGLLFSVRLQPVKAEQRKKVGPKPSLALGLTHLVGPKPPLAG